MEETFNSCSKNWHTGINCDIFVSNFIIKDTVISKTNIEKQLLNTKYRIPSVANMATP